MKLILCNSPPGDAKHIAKALVKERLAACVNILPGVTSIYRWDGKVFEDDEVTMLIKTNEARLQETMDRITVLHPYEVPEIIVLPVNQGHQPYFDWVDQCVAHTTGEA